jgi:hypothetical protein
MKKFIIPASLIFITLITIIIHQAIQNKAFKNEDTQVGDIVIFSGVLVDFNESCSVDASCIAYVDNKEIITNPGMVKDPVYIGHSNVWTENIGEIVEVKAIKTGSNKYSIAGDSKKYEQLYVKTLSTGKKEQVSIISYIENGFSWVPYTNNECGIRLQVPEFFDIEERYQCEILFFINNRDEEDYLSVTEYLAINNRTWGDLTYKQKTKVSSEEPYTLGGISTIKTEYTFEDELVNVYFDPITPKEEQLNISYTLDLNNSYDEKEKVKRLFEEIISTIEFY